MNEYTDGDILTLEHPNGSRLIGVAKGDVVRIEEEYYAHTISAALRNGFTITNVEKPAPQLPTVPGLYVASDNIDRLASSVIWRLDRSGQWKGLNSSHNHGPEHALKSLGGLTRLVPEA